MNRIQAIFLIYEAISSYVPDDKYTERIRHLLANYEYRLILADYIVRLVETYDTPLEQESSDTPTTDLVDEMENPFYILEQEIANMRLNENNDWD